MTHICVGNLTIIGSDNGLSPGWRQAIIWTNAGILLIGPLGKNCEMVVTVILSRGRRVKPAANYLHHIVDPIEWCWPTARPRDGKGSGMELDLTWKDCIPRSDKETNYGLNFFTFYMIPRHYSVAGVVSYPQQNVTIPFSHSQYYGCWWHSDIRSLDISRLDNNRVCCEWSWSR